MQREWTRAAERFHTFAVFNIGGSIGRTLLLVVGMIESSPLFLLFIPPDKFLALAPGLAVGARGRPVVDDAAVVGPGKTPTVPEQIFGVAFVGAVVAWFRKHSAINPGAAGRGSIFLQIFDVLQLLAVGQRIAVDFLQNFGSAGLGVLAFGRIVPGESVESGVARTRIGRHFGLEPATEVIHEPQFAAR